MASPSKLDVLPFPPEILYEILSGIIIDSVHELCAPPFKDAPWPKWNGLLSLAHVSRQLRSTIFVIACDLFELTLDDNGLFPFQRIFKAVKYTRDLSLVEGEDPSARIVHLLATDIPGFGTSDNPVYDEYPGVLSYYYGASLHNLLKGCYNILLRLPPPRNWDGLARFIDHAAQQQELLPKMREFRRFPTHRLSPLHWRAREYMLRSVLTLQGGWHAWIGKCFTAIIPGVESGRELLKLFLKDYFSEEERVIDLAKLWDDSVDLPLQDRVQRTIDNVMTNFDVEQCFAFAGLVQTRWRPFLEDYYLKTKDST